MNKLAQAIAGEMGVSPETAQFFLDALVRQSYAAIERGEDVNIDGLVSIRHYWSGDSWRDHIATAYCDDRVHEAVERIQSKPQSQEE